MVSDGAITCQVGGHSAEPRPHHNGGMNGDTLRTQLHLVSTKAIIEALKLCVESNKGIIKSLKL